MKILITVAIEKEPFATDHIGIKQGLDELNIDYKLLDPTLRTDEQFIEQVVNFKPDIVVHYMNELLIRGIPKMIAKQFDCKQVFWELDYRPLSENIEESYDGKWEGWKEQFKYIDHIFISNKGQLEAWEKFFNVSTAYLPHGTYIPEKLIKNERYHYQTVFIGGTNDGDLFRPRKELIDSIGKHVKVKQINEVEKNERNRIWKDMSQIYYTSDISLDISHFWNNPGYFSGRHMYTAGLGGCSVTKRFPDCEEYFKDKKHKWFFDTADEAIHIIRWLLQHPDIIEKTKIDVWNHCKEKHHFKYRFLEMFKVLKI